MKILMLGWEYPPIVTGGLATATEGLVNGLLALGHEVTLILPYYPFPHPKPHLTIVSPELPIHKAQSESTRADVLHTRYTELKELSPPYSEYNLNAWENSHYAYTLQEIWKAWTSSEWEVVIEKLRSREIQLQSLKGQVPWPMPLFHSFEEQAFVMSLLAVDAIEQLSFDIIHAHDWMSFPAVNVLKSRVKIPIVVHIHSTEYDRAGNNGNAHILALEHYGVQVATRILTVSRYTKNTLIERYQVPSWKVEVVYNASNERHASQIQIFKELRPLHNPPVVTFIGRITYQKGPAYFVQAAQHVLAKRSDVHFMVVGSGDLLNAMKQLVWELNIDYAFTFMGFANAAQVQEVLKNSDIFIMPSVSEPFGIVALEAVQQGVPVIISRQSGVAEVLPNALKVDYWDTELIADRILSLLEYPLLRTELINNAQRDLKKRTWHHAALKCEEIYKKAIEEHAYHN